MQGGFNLLINILSQTRDHQNIEDVQLLTSIAQVLEGHRSSDFCAAFAERVQFAVDFMYEISRLATCSIQKARK